MALRLPFTPRKPQLLTTDETKFIGTLVGQHLAWVNHEKAKGPVSESVLRTEFYAESVRAKIEESGGK